MNRTLFLLIFCSGCCTAIQTPRQLRFEHGEAWFYGEGEPRKRIERFEPMESDVTARWFPDDKVVNFKYSWDPAHFELYAILVILLSGGYKILTGENDVVRFLENRMKEFQSERDVHDFLELFTSMRGYTLVEKAPEIIDARTREGKKSPRKIIA